MGFCVAFGFGRSAFAVVSFALFAGPRSVLVWSSCVAVVSFVLNVGSRSALFWSFAFGLVFGRVWCCFIFPLFGASCWSTQAKNWEVCVIN